MNAAVIYLKHHTMFGKINKALQKIRVARDFLEEQKNVLDEMQQVDNYAWNKVK